MAGKKNLANLGGQNIGLKWNDSDIFIYFFSLFIIFSLLHSSPVYIFSVRVGSSFSTTGGQIIKLADYKAHPEFTYAKMDKYVLLVLCIVAFKIDTSED